MIYLKYFESQDKWRSEWDEIEWKSEVDKGIDRELVDNAWYSFALEVGNDPTGLSIFEIYALDLIIAPKKSYIHILYHFKSGGRDIKYGVGMRPIPSDINSFEDAIFEMSNDRFFYKMEIVRKHDVPWSESIQRKQDDLCGRVSERIKKLGYDSVQNVSSIIISKQEIDRKFFKPSTYFPPNFKFNEELRKLNPRHIEERKPGDLFEELEQTKFYSDMRSKTYEKFTDAEINKISQFLSKYTSDGIKITGKYLPLTMNYLRLMDGNPSDFFDYIKKIGPIPIEIWKTSDEWYYVNLNYSRYIRCDQFDGLMQCLSRKTIPTNTI